MEEKYNQGERQCMCGVKKILGQITELRMDRRDFPIYAESQICRNKTLAQSVFRCLQYLLPGQKSDKGCTTEGGKF